MRLHGGKKMVVTWRLRNGGYIGGYIGAPPGSSNPRDGWSSGWGSASGDKGSTSRLRGRYVERRVGATEDELQLPRREHVDPRGGDDLTKPADKGLARPFQLYVEACAPPIGSGREWMWQLQRLQRLLREWMWQA